MVEPIPDYFESLQRAYYYHPGVKPVRAALRPSAREMVMYRVKSGKANEPWENGITLFSREHLSAHDIADENICEELVPCMTFEGLIEQYMGADVALDIPAIDTEGLYSEILRMIDFRKLKEMGYGIHQTREDCVAIKRSIKIDPLSYIVTIAETQGNAGQKSITGVQPL